MATNTKQSLMPAGNALTVSPQVESVLRTTPAGSRAATGWDASARLEHVKSSDSVTATTQLPEQRLETVHDGADRTVFRRQVASKTSEEENLELIQTHQQLAMKKMMNGELSRAERGQLALVRWELDRIRDGKLGPQLDALRAVVEQKRALAADIRSFRADVESAARPQRKSR